MWSVFGGERSNEARRDEEWSLAKDQRWYSTIISFIKANWPDGNIQDFPWVSITMRLVVRPLRRSKFLISKL